VFAGFAPTYYLKAWFGTPTLPTLVHVHGLVMSAWFVVFATQVWLVESHRIRLHRRLGLFGAALVVLIPILGIATAIEGARRHAGPPGIPPLIFLSVPIFDILVFAGIAGSGLLLRRRSDFHRRLMLLATLGILTAPIARLPLDFIRHGGPLVFFGLADGDDQARVARQDLTHPLRGEVLEAQGTVVRVRRFAHEELALAGLAAVLGTWLVQPSLVWALLAFALGALGAVLAARSRRGPLSSSRAVTCCSGSRDRSHCPRTTALRFSSPTSRVSRIRFSRDVIAASSASSRPLP